jgi:hypothetical protein
MQLHFMLNSDNSSIGSPSLAALFRARGNRFGVSLHRKFQGS